MPHSMVYDNRIGAASKLREYEVIVIVVCIPTINSNTLEILLNSTSPPRLLSGYYNEKEWMHLDIDVLLSHQICTAVNAVIKTN